MESAPSPPSTSSSKRRKHACLQCRSRKVRCDGHQDTCGNCQRLNFDCSFKESNGADANGTRVNRLRTRKACAECRSQKIKCSGESPVCANCIRRGKHCSFAGSPLDIFDDVQDLSLPEPEQVIDNFHAAYQEEARTSALPTGIELVRMVDDFFHHVHPLAMFAFQHPATVKQKCAEDTLDGSLTLAICSVTALKVNMAQYYPTSTEGWISRCEDNLWRDIDSPSVTKLQAMLLVMMYRIESEMPAKAFMLAAIAARMASALHLHYERTELGPVQRETRRRIMWTLAVLDGLFALGLPEYEVAAFENIYVQLPCKETIFAAGEAVKTEHLRPSGTRHIENLGCLAFNIRLASMRRDIMRLNRQLTLSDQPAPYLADLVQKFDGILNGINNDLCRTHAYSPAMLQIFIEIGWLPRFLAAHLSLHQTYCDLYRLFLPGYTEAISGSALKSMAPEMLRAGREKCKDHALSVVEILQQVQSATDEWMILDIDNAICAYHAARLVIFLWKSSASEEKLDQLDCFVHAGICLAFLRRFFSSSAYARPLIQDLEMSIEQETLPTHNSAVSSMAIGEWIPGGSWLPREGYRHQRLAIHSLLRRTHFVDDIDDFGMSMSSPASTFHSANDDRRSAHPT